MLLTYRLVHLLCYGLQISGLLLRLISLCNIPQQQGVPSQSLQRRHQQVAQLQPPTLLVPLTPLKGQKKRGRQRENRVREGLEKKEEVTRVKELVMVFLGTEEGAGRRRGCAMKETKRPKYNKSFNKYISMMTGKVTPGTNGHIPLFASLGDTELVGVSVCMCVCVLSHSWHHIACLVVKVHITLLLCYCSDFIFSRPRGVSSCTFT